jgi:ABC-type antimicrobial peptide transport system permease subunit
MNLRDLISISIGNLWRMKLRAFLTISGVVIAITTFVSMVSFGAGNQKLISDQFEQLGLFSTILVYPPDESENDSAQAVVLDDGAIAKLSQIQGVILAYPYDEFEVKAAFADTELTTSAQALPDTALKTRLFSHLLAGRVFPSDSAKDAIISNELLDGLNIENPDSVIGKQIIISVKVASIDSGLINIFQDKDGEIEKRLNEIWIDSLLRFDYFSKIARRELSSAAMRFVDGFINSPKIISDTLTICGVYKINKSRRLRIKPIIIPIATASVFNSAGFSDDPVELFSALRSGKLFDSGNNPSKYYPQATLCLDPYVSYESVRDSVKAMGFKTFSFAESFKEIRRFFFYFNIALGIVGLVALITASLGIANTMVMSILERTREIGVLKSLGADESYIRLLFLVESGVIGTIGALIGILSGWIVTRVISLIARIIMEKQGWDIVELFAMPLWLIMTAFLFGLLVSLAAGYFPASRAARVDPVQALRND